MKRLRIKQVLVVEGRYDASTLAGVVDGLILTTGGFSIFSDAEQKALIQKLGRTHGLIVLTDSDAAGFAIRNYIEQIAAGCEVRHAYVPAVHGKERRKTAPGKEGLLGVEGMPPQLLREALLAAGAGERPPKEGRPITYTDLYAWGLSGTPHSAQERRGLLLRLGLPQRLSKRALCRVLNSLYTFEEFEAAMAEKPVLFWDFHGTLTEPDVVWFDAAMEAAAEQAPEFPLSLEVLKRHLGGTCLPWFTVPSGDTRHMRGADWWRHSEAEFVGMFQKCGFTAALAEKISAAMRPKILQPQRYTLYPDALPTLRALQKRGYQSYILSNNFPELAEVATGLGLAPYLGGVLVSGEIGYDKPRREIFEAALAAAGHPKAAWMMGDNPRDDMEGARAAGFTTVAVHGVKAPTADYHIDNLEEILGLLP